VVGSCNDVLAIAASIRYIGGETGVEIGVLHFIRAVDGWLIEKMDGFGKKLQTEDRIHYGSIIVRPFAVLASLATISVFAQFALFTPIFWFALTPYLISVWPIFFVVWFVMRKDRRNWDLAKVRKWNGYCQIMRNSPAIRVAGWVWLFMMGCLAYIVPPFFTGDPLPSALLKALLNLPALLLQVGTVVIYLYIICIRPVLPGAVTRRTDKAPTSVQMQALR
jgi:hypothetical protein